MEKIPPRTYEVQTGFNLGMLRSEDWVDWAGEAITADFDSPSLRILAGLQSPYDDIEINRLWNKSFVELKIIPLPEEQIVPFFVSTILQQTLTRKQSQKQTLTTLMSLCLSKKYDRQLMDFYLLYHAMSDLEHDTTQWYWDGANRNNISKIVDDYFHSWLKNHGQDLPI